MLTLCTSAIPSAFAQTRARRKKRLSRGFFEYYGCLSSRHVHCGWKITRSIARWSDVKVADWPGRPCVTNHASCDELRASLDFILTPVLLLQHDLAAECGHYVPTMALIKARSELSFSMTVVRDARCSVHAEHTTRVCSAVFSLPTLQWWHSKFAPSRITPHCVFFRSSYVWKAESSPSATGSPLDPPD